MENNTYTFKKPTPKQVAWLFSHLKDHFLEGGTYRYLICNRLEYNEKDYQILHEDCGTLLSLMANDYIELNEIVEQLLKYYNRENGLTQEELRGILHSIWNPSNS